MGIFNQGILGGFSGKVGTVVGSNWREKDVMRSRPRFRRNRTTTPAQEEQKARFSLASKLTGYLSNLIKTSYGKAGSKKAHNSAYQEILASVIGGVYPNLVVDYSKLPVAKGKINTAFNPVAESLQPGSVKFSWDDNSSLQQASPNDNAILVVFCEEMQELMYKLNGAARFLMEDEIDVSFFSGKQVHTWISFISSDQRNTADSLYTGMVTVL